jgi:hypothetical protein
MLSAEALRLAAIEVLCPTASQESGSGYPTLAGKSVFDSRAAALEDLDPSAPYTPVLALYTSESGVSLRGHMAAADDTLADAVLDVVAELAVTANDDSGDFVDAMADDDPGARLVLGALCAQVRRELERSQRGNLFRRIVSRIVKVEQQAFAMPNYGLRWQRVMMRFHCEIRDDEFDMAPGGLPEPIRSLYEALPDGSYAKSKLSLLASYFHQEAFAPLEGIDVNRDTPALGFTFKPGA